MFVAAVLLGSLASGAQARAGAVLVLACAAIVVYNVPTSEPADFLFTPLVFFVGWVAGFALRLLMRMESKNLDVSIGMADFDYAMQKASSLDIANP